MLVLVLSPPGSTANLTEGVKAPQGLVSGVVSAQVADILASLIDIYLLWEYYTHTHTHTHTHLSLRQTLILGDNINYRVRQETFQQYEQFPYLRSLSWFLPGVLHSKHGSTPVETAVPSVHKRLSERTFLIMA